MGVALVLRVVAACSGPLPKATNATQPFFRDCWYFNASLNNLSGPIPEDFSRSLIFNASAGFNWAASFLGRAEALKVARQFAFDVSNNSLSGDLPSFLAPAKLPKYLNASSVQLKVSTPPLTGTSCPGKLLQHLRGYHAAAVGNRSGFLAVICHNI